MDFVNDGPVYRFYLNSEEESYYDVLLYDPLRRCYKKGKAYPECTMYNLANRQYYDIIRIPEVSYGNYNDRELEALNRQLREYYAIQDTYNKITNGKVESDKVESDKVESDADNEATDEDTTEDSDDDFEVIKREDAEELITS
jgi:hypothetical protein